MREQMERAQAEGRGTDHAQLREQALVTLASARADYFLDPAGGKVRYLEHESALEGEESEGPEEAREG